MRVIEVNRLIKRIMNNEIHMHRNPNIYTSLITDDLIFDAEPVRHGTWKESKIKTGGQISLSIPCYLCSECGGYMDASPLIFKYCPYCGAKMDAEAIEE